MKKLNIPVGVDRFHEMITQKNYYVDKTHIIQNLVKSTVTHEKISRRYFLSRPRRFGKSLLVDTIKCLFEGKKQLFKGLAIYDHWDFSDKHPVIKLSLDIGGMATTEQIHVSVIQQLETPEEEYELSAGSDKAKDNASNKLADVLKRLHKKTGKGVVVLIDEYDKPILDVLHVRDEKTGKAQRATDNLECLRDIYGTLKGCSDYIHFIFVTGISVFSKTNLFSGLNNLIDISVETKFATICGYTEEELKSVFAPEITKLELAEIRRWYDGYSWDEEQRTPRLFCPQSVLNLLRTGRYKHWWHQDSAPKYLYYELQKKHLTTLELTARWVTSDLLNSFDVEDSSCYSLLYQSGYLTIRGLRTGAFGTEYLLTYPNLEVQRGMIHALLKYMLSINELPIDFNESGHKIIAALDQSNLSALQSELIAIFAKMPHYWHDEMKKRHIPRPQLQNYEFWYASILHGIFSVLTTQVKVEEVSHHGRSDLVVTLNNKVYVIELKCGDSRHKDQLAAGAIDQIRDRGYATKYHNKGHNLYALAIVFCKKERNLTKLVLEQIE